MAALTETTESPDYDFSTDPHGVTKEEILSSDFFLTNLMEMSFGHHNERKGSIGLTVVCDGVVISGIAISGSEWDRRIVESLSASHSGLGSAFAELADDMRARRKEVIEARIQDERPLPPFRYIHMRNARVNTGILAQEMPLWRGELSKVSGWTIGSTNTSEESKDA